MVVNLCQITVCFISPSPQYTALLLRGEVGVFDSSLSSYPSFVHSPPTHTHTVLSTLLFVLSSLCFNHMSLFTPEKMTSSYQRPT